jgi:hypothetical protein
MFGQVRTGYVKLDLVISGYVSLVQVRFGYAGYLVKSGYASLGQVMHDRTG